MDQLRAYVEAAAAAAAESAQGNVPVVVKIQMHGIMFGAGDAVTGVPAALPRFEETVAASGGQGNDGVALMGTDKGMAVLEGGAEGCDGDLMKCAECEKVFKSCRALYGHLRSHPEKGYRGASRPTNAAAASAPVAEKRKGKKPRKMEQLITDEEAAMILMDISWGQSYEEPDNVPMHRAPRQMPAPEQRMLTADPVTDAAATAVAQPVIPDHVTVEGQSTWEAEKPAQVEHVLELVMETSPEAGRAVRAEHVAMITTEPQSPEVIKKSEPVADGVLAVPLNEHGVVAAAGKPAMSPGAHSSKKLSPSIRKSKKRKLQDLEQAPVTPSSECPAADVVIKPPMKRIPSPASDRRYVCQFANCGKAFFTHQALGGHVAGHHHRDKDGGGAQQQQHVDTLAVADTEAHIHHDRRHAVGDDAAAASLGEEHRDSPPAPAPAPAPAAQIQALQHRCTHPNCNMLFRSGQSLGGHMRKHRPIAQATKASSSALQLALATEAAPPPTQPVPSRTPRAFDLNELPKDEESKP